MYNYSRNSQRVIESYDSLNSSVYAMKKTKKAAYIYIYIPCFCPVMRIRPISNCHRVPNAAVCSKTNERTVFDIWPTFHREINV